MCGLISLYGLEEERKIRQLQFPPRPDSLDPNGTEGSPWIGRESSGCFGSNAKGPSRQRNERGRRVVFLSACYFLTDPSKTINDPKDKRERERGPSLLLLLLNFLLVFCCLLSFNGLQAAVCKNLTSVYCY